jgi:hypothetical protein
LVSEVKSEMCVIAMDATSTIQSSISLTAQELLHLLHIHADSNFKGERVIFHPFLLSLYVSLPPKLGDSPIAYYMFEKKVLFSQSEKHTYV